MGEQQNVKMTSGKALLLVLVAVACALSLGLAACGGGGSSAAAGKYKDGTYSGESKVLEAGVDGDGYAQVSITVKNGSITDVVFQAFAPDGTPKDESYGKGSSNYALAQRIVGEVDKYANSLVEVQVPDDVDVISGATFLHDQFVEAAKNALAQAKA